LLCIYKTFDYLILIIIGKVHGALSRAGKVRDHTPKVAKTATGKKPTGRHKKRIQFNKRFLNIVQG
jgi:small subunit ribosomal protein S30e